MARRPPARVRAGLRHLPRPSNRSPRRVVPGVSAHTQRLIADFERARAEPGAVALAVADWSERVHSQQVHEPGPPIDDCMCCIPHGGRELVERALRALPRRAAAELRAVVRPLDEVFLARVRPDPEFNGRQEWWTY